MAPLGRFFLSVFSVVVPATAAPADAQIRWKTGGTQTLPVLSAAEVRTTLAELAARPDRRHLVVQLTQPLTPALRERLGAAGLILLDYLGDNAFFAALSAGRFDAAALAREETLRSVAAIEDHRKLHPDLLDKKVHPWMVVPRGGADTASPEELEEARKLDLANPIVGLYVVFHKDVLLDPDATRICHAYGAFIRSYLYTINALVIELPYDLVPSLAAEDGVAWVEPPLPALSELNAENRARVGANIVQAPPYNLSGAGVKVMVYDGGKARTTHVDFQGRLVIGANEPACSSVSDHATHVSGTVGGAGIADPNERGMAPGVEIVSYGYQQDPQGDACPPLTQGFLYTDPGDIQADYDQAINTYGADISNNSIGTNTAPNGFPCEWEGNYGVTDTLIDSIVRGSLGTPFRVVWANGNERQVSTCGTTYHTTAPPACAKNHITVGALNSNDDSMTSFSSWGPADDDRMKPDITAPGCEAGGDGGVRSCSSSSNTAYSVKCGTSMASPTVCGISALLLEDYRAQFPALPDPRNSTLKILLAHTAVDLGNVGPDYRFGYGSVRIQPAVDFMRTGNFVEKTLSGTGASELMVVVVSPSDTSLKVTLAWDDPPGTPTVNPALVNDLDLRVFDAANNQYFPWTLGGLANPAAAAVRTQRNGVDNIEQVVIDNPAPGAYRVEVFGFNVPQGPQPFSICASPLLVNCSSQGILTLDRVKYPCSGPLTVQVVDCDLNTDNGSIQTVDVIVASTSEPAGETLTLTETSAETATFRGTLNIGPIDSPGVLLVAKGDTITATYIDADDGQGGMNVTVTDTAPVDCSPPVISNFQVTSIQPRSATISFNTDEPANGTVRFGTDCRALAQTSTETGFRTVHSYNLINLSVGTQYFFAIDALDEAGNTVSDDNGGACFTFTTPDLPELYTELFGAGDPNDLDNTSFLFAPDGSIDYYAACAVPITVLPTDPAGGTVVTLADNASTPITLAGGVNVLLYGVAYNTVRIGSNGYLTFTTADTDASESLADHFNRPRVSALFDDLNPALAGAQVSYKQLPDRFVVTWLNVPEATTTNQNTFQIEMYFDGRIQISHLNIAATDGLVGLSAGLGLSPDFFESNFSAFGACGPRPPSAASFTVEVPQDTPQPITLLAGDDGIPNPTLSYIVTSLPTHELRDASNDHVIVPGELPYTLSAGNMVVYRPSGGFTGPDSFQFKANDGGTPPDGGDSNLATVTLNVVPLLVLPFADSFPTTTFDAGKWGYVSNATVDTTGLNPPSPPYVARFNGDPTGGDELRTHMIDLSGQTVVRLRYSWQVRGNGESPDANDDLFVEYQNAAGAWTLLRQHFGTLPDMTTFTLEQLTLPAGAYHAAFRLRFRNTATVGNFDDWLVDDVSLNVPNAPEASSTAVTTNVNVFVNITLPAVDPNLDPLTYTILSLPANGRLRDPATGTLLSAPYTLANGGNVVRYTPPPGYLGPASFTWKASDGTYDSNVATVNITVGGPQVVHDFPLSTNPGWATQGQWAFGQPTGGGSFNRDPTSGYTGPNVYGYNLAGDYPNNLNPPQYLTTTAIDCTNRTGVQLRFRRWLGIESASFDHANVQVSNDGTTWTTVWDHTGAAVAETAWSLQTYSLAAVADNQPTVFVRWGMGTTDVSVTYPGWNIDDVQILAIVPNPCGHVVLGDTNQDGAVNALDTQDFTRILVGQGIYSPAALCAADTMPDGTYNQQDVDEFVFLLLDSPVP